MTTRSHLTKKFSKKVLQPTPLRCVYLILEQMKRKTIIYIILGVFVLVAATVSVYMHRMVRGFHPDSKMDRILAAGIQFVDYYVPFHGDSLFVKTTGNPDSTPALLIHGSPGYWSDWENILADPYLRNHFHLIVYDRPGYGNTTVPVTADLKVEANAALQIIETFGNLDSTQFTVVGHSYGGPVVEELMLNYPEKIRKSVLVAALLNPAFHHPKWYNYLASFPLFDPLIPKPLRQSNKEMWSLANELAANEQQLKDFDIETIFIQGEKDILVPFETAAFYKQYDTTNIKYILPKDLNHFTPWSHPDLIINAIRN